MTQYAVYRDSWRWNASEIIRTTEKKTIVRDGRERHLLTQDVRCVLPETEARRLAKQLSSSEALMRNDQRRAALRHHQRVDELCLKATAAAA